MFKLDIDRLHKVFHRELNGRQIGKTTAVCYQALGYVEVENKDIFILTERDVHSRYIIDQLTTILRYEKYNFTFQNDEIIILILSENISHFVKKVKVTICSRESYDYKHEESGYDHILLFDFSTGAYDGYNSAQCDWERLSKDMYTKEAAIWNDALTQVARDLRSKQTPIIKTSFTL